MGTWHDNVSYYTTILITLRDYYPTLKVMYYFTIYTSVAEKGNWGGEAPSILVVGGEFQVILVGGMYH